MSNDDFRIVNGNFCPAHQGKMPARTFKIRGEQPFRTEAGINFNDLEHINRQYRATEVSQRFQRTHGKTASIQDQYPLPRE